MDRQNRVGSKPGAGGIASQSQQNLDKKSRLRKLAMETIDLANDPYLMRNHLGSYECRLCLKLHYNEGSYLAHVQGRKHQENLARRAAKEVSYMKTHGTVRNRVHVRTNKSPIGTPGYKILRLKSGDELSRNERQGFLFKLVYPLEGIKSIADFDSKSPVGNPEPDDNEDGVDNWKDLNLELLSEPNYRFMSAFEQKIEPPNKDYQYVIFSLYPFQNVSFKIPSKDIDRDPSLFWSKWDKDNGTFFLQIMFKR